MVDKLSLLYAGFQYIHYFSSPTYYMLVFALSPSFAPQPRAEVAGICDDYFSAHGSYLPDTRAVSPLSVKLMSCKNSINALPQCSFSLYFPLILSLLFISISLPFNPIFLTSLLYFSFLLLSNCSWTVPSLCCLCFCVAHTHSFMRFCLHALTHGSI